MDLLHKRFIVFELDNISENRTLLPVVTIIIMETFLAKMRRLQGVRKVLLLEEAWKAIAKEGMASYVRYLFKTVRKYFGEAIVVTQEVEDIISSPIVKECDHQQRRLQDSTRPAQIHATSSTRYRPCWD